MNFGRRLFGAVGTFFIIFAAILVAPSALRARGRPRFTALAPSSGAEISSSVLGGRDIGGFCKGCACLGSVQGVNDAVDL